jgi:hypothetical protein
VQQQHVGSVPHGQRRDVVAPDRHVVDLQQGRAAGRQPEHSLEADGVVEVAGHAEQAPFEGVDSGHLSGPQGQPGGGIGRKGHVGRSARRALAHPSAMRRAPNFPGVSKVTELDSVRRVEPRIGSQIPVGEASKRLFDGDQAV